MTTTNLQLSNRLKDLGVKIETEYWWRVGAGIRLMCESYPQHFDTSDCFEKIPAPTVEELGEMFNKIGADLFIKAYGEVFNFKGTQNVGVLGVINLMRNPDMSARMIIYLVENKLIKI